MTAITSNHSLPDLVPQTYTKLELPSQHLSLLPAVLHNLVEPLKMLPTNARNTLGIDQNDMISSATIHSKFTEETSDCIGSSKMLSGSGHAMAQVRQRSSAYNTRPGLALPRSASAIDLRARSALEDTPHPTKWSTFQQSPLDQLDQHLTENFLPQRIGMKTERTSAYRHATIMPNTDQSQIQRSLRRKINYKSYQDLHILSMYDDSSVTRACQSRSSEVSSIEDCGQEITSDYSSTNESSEDDLSPSPRTPYEDSFQGEDVISEQCEKRLKREQFRHVHIIEHHRGKEYFDADEDGEVVPVSICSREWELMTTDALADESDRAYSSW